MTRETKLGLVVAGSFLALVGGVVVARLKQIDMPGDAEVAAAQPTPVAEAQATPVANASGSPEPEKHRNPVSSDAVANAGGAKMPSPKADPPPDPFPAPVAPQPTPVLEAQAPAPMSSPVMTPSPVVPAPAQIELVGPPPPDPNAPEPPTPVVTAPPMEPMTPAPAPAPPEPAPPVVAPKPDPTPTPVVAAPIPEMPEPPKASPPAPVVKQEPPAPVVKQTPVADAPGSPPPPLNPNVANNSVPTVTVIPASGGTNTAAGLEPPRVPAAGPAREPFAAPPRPATPPEPKRDSYLEEQYRWNAGDNFAGLSTKNYGTPKYADALLKYNQDYPLASREMRQNPPALAPGQVVWVPPVRILERDYANHIRDLTPITPATPTSRPAVEPVTPPPGLANSGFGNSAGQLYRVRAPGESVQEIARRTLGNSALAARVQGLNPTLSPDPRLPIPAGTVLRLPGDARVDATDKP